MIVKPKIRGFICTTAHPLGCEQNVKSQIDYVRKMPKIDGAKRVLIIGSSTGYGLATRIAAAFGSGAKTLGVAFEKPAGNRTATAGWYNTAAFEKFAAQEGLYAKDIIGDAYSKEIKDQVISLIKKDLGTVDLVVYSLAAPRRKMADGTTYSSVIKPVGEDFSNKTIDMRTRDVTSVTVEAATQQEVNDTIKVMGGEDWTCWMKALSDAGVLANGVRAIAYSYIGPEITHPVYRDGTIGQAKKDLEEAAHTITEKISPLGGKAFISVNKAVVTQASSAIPVVPLYITILFKVMKAKGLHEGCIEQMYRLLAKKLYDGEIDTDDCGRIRMDDLEFRDDVQAKVMKAWHAIDSSNLREFADIDGYWSEFYHLFGFEIDDVDYDKDIPIDVQIPNLCTLSQQ